MKWVSVDDELPEEHTIVLVYENWEQGCSFSVGFQIDNDFYYENTHESIEAITHWQQLPPPPKGE